MNFQEMGLELKQARERRGMSLDEVVEITKISRRNIVALEDGNIDHLPHPVYAKGFIRSYARLLGLDGDTLAMVVDQEIDESEASQPIGYEVTPGTDKAFNAAESYSTEGKSRWPSILLFLGLVVLLGALVFYFGKVKNDQPSSASTAPQASVQQEEASAPEVLGDAAQDDGMQSDTEEHNGAAAEAAPSSLDEQSAVQEDDSEQIQTPPEEEQGIPAEEEHTVVPADQETVGEAAENDSDAIVYAHQIVIRATTDKGCWIGVWKGDQDRMYRDFFLRNGEPLTLKFNSKRRVRIGNVAGIEMTHNGQPFPLNLEKGNAQTFIFEVP